VPPAPLPGQEYVYNPPSELGFGEAALGQPLSAEMQELDLKPGTQVTMHSYEVDSNWPIVEWVDGKGLDRMTTVQPSVFTRDFEYVPAGRSKK
jgi:hypothetical protein